MKAKIKICGLSTKHAVKAADDADYAGFIVGSPKSHRNISIKKFNELREGLHYARPVLVTVNHSIKFLHKIHQIDDVIIQLHGQARSFVNMINHSAIGLNVDEFSQKKYFQPYTYSFLSVDSTTTEGYGGTGKVWDWKKMNLQKEKKIQPILVAGGIDFSNVANALARTDANGVDVSSSVEVKKQKSPQKIRDFIELVRGL